MKKRDSLIHQKLQNRKGASITLALFLFLICVVIGSVVLTAGTAAAGRRAQLAQADRRYYAVTSAAELFHTVIPGESVLLERTKTVESTYVYTLEQDDEEHSRRKDGDPNVEIGEPTYTNTLTTLDGTSLDGNDSILLDVVKTLIPPSTSTDLMDFDWNLEDYTESEPVEYTLSHDGAPDGAALDVKVKMEISKNGDLVFTFSSTDSESDVYVLRETFRLKYDETEEESSEEGAGVITGSSAAKEYTETITVKTISSKQTTFAWEFVNLEPVSKAG